MFPTAFHTNPRCICTFRRSSYSSLLKFSAGEIFGGLDIAPGFNDSQALLQALSAGKAPDVFNCLRGPWAAVYWHADSRTLWFGRDVLGTESACLSSTVVLIDHCFGLHTLTCYAVTGRRSLLMHLPSSPDDCFCLVSAAPAALVANLGGKAWSAKPSQGSQAADHSGVEKEENSLQHSTLQVCPWQATATADARYQGRCLYAHVQILAHADEA